LRRYTGGMGDRLIRAFSATLKANKSHRSGCHPFQTPHSPREKAQVLKSLRENYVLPIKSRRDV
jgi:hypothetical protein